MKKMILVFTFMIMSTLASAGIVEYCESLNVTSVFKCVSGQKLFRTVLAAEVKFRREYTEDSFDVLYLLCLDYHAKPEYNTIDWVLAQQCYSHGN